MLIEKIANSIKYSLRFRYPLPRQLIHGYMEWHLLASVLHHNDINVVIDVGANVGQFAANLRRIGFRSHIYSFEPVKIAYQKLSHKFRNDRYWQGFDFALGAESGEQLIHTPLESTAMSSLLRPNSPGWDIEKQLVKVKRLDEIFDDLAWFSRGQMHLNN